MIKEVKEHTETDIEAYGYYLRKLIYGVELNEDEQILATMSILKFGEVEIPTREIGKIEEFEWDGKYGFISKYCWVAKPIYEHVWASLTNVKGKFKISLDGKQHIATEHGLEDGEGYDNDILLVRRRKPNEPIEITLVIDDTTYGKKGFGNEVSLNNEDYDPFLGKTICIRDDSD